MASHGAQLSSPGGSQVDVQDDQIALVVSGGGGWNWAFGDDGSTTLPGVFFPVQATTVGAPAYVLGGMYFDTTLNKLRIGGASGWETVTSA